MPVVDNVFRGDPFSMGITVESARLIRFGRNDLIQN